MNPWIPTLVVLCIIIPIMVIFYRESAQAGVLDHITDIISFACGSFFGYLTGKK